MEFIFMLTRDDRTVADAIAVYRQVRTTGLRHVGFKDVGVSAQTLAALTDAIHEDGHAVHLEVVSTSRDEELRSVEAAVKVGVDYLLGGTHTEDALALLAGSPVRYCPFPGVVVGHPSELQGSVDDIAQHCAQLTGRDGIYGVDLLAYRHRGVPPEELMSAAVRASSGPVIVAGSIDSEQRIRAAAQAGAWGYTIGGAIFEGRLPGGPSVPAQVEWALSVSHG